MYVPRVLLGGMVEWRMGVGTITITIRAPVSPTATPALTVVSLFRVSHDAQPPYSLIALLRFALHTNVMFNITSFL